MFKKGEQSAFLAAPKSLGRLCFEAWRAGQQLDKERRNGVQQS